MITVSTKDLVEAIREANAYKRPDMNDGTNYLYDRIHRRMAYGSDVRLSELDFDAFEQEDVNTFHDLYSDIFEPNLQIADSISAALHASDPVCKTVGYVGSTE